MTTAEPEVLTEARGALGLITLNRPKALNALSLGMIERIEAALARWAEDDKIGAVLIQGAGGKAFCAGGDVRAIATTKTPAMAPLHRLFFGAEYRLNYHIHTYRKPFIAVIDGITMGGGCGLSLHGSHIVATERTVLAMPETVLGLFPDVGATWFLNRLPGEMGVYLGLSGVRLGAADLVALGLATNYVPSGDIAELIDCLAAARPLDPLSVDSLLAAHGRNPGPAVVAPRRQAVDRLFCGETVAEIVTRLDLGEPPWAEEARTTIARASPTSLAITLHQLRSGRGLDLAEMLRIEYRLAVRCSEGHDFPEGVRAILVDKDNAPRWHPARIEAVDAASLDAYFAPFADPQDELVLEQDGDGRSRTEF